MGYVLIVWVENVQDFVCIAGLTCCENYNLKLFVQIFKNLFSIGPNIDSRLNYSSIIKLYPHFYIEFFR